MYIFKWTKEASGLTPACPVQSRQCYVWAASPGQFEKAGNIERDDGRPGIRCLTEAWASRGDS